MQPDEVLETLSKAGIHRDKRTLQRYAKAGLIPKPETKAAGRGKGKIADYPQEAPAEMYASLQVMNNYQQFNVNDVAKLRKAAFHLKDDSGPYRLSKVVGDGLMQSFFFVFAVLWLNHKKSFQRFQETGDPAELNAGVQEGLQAMENNYPGDFGKGIREFVDCLKGVQLE